MERRSKSRVHLDEHVAALTHLLVPPFDGVLNEGEEGLIDDRSPDIYDPVTRELLNLSPLRRHVLEDILEVLQEGEHLVDRERVVHEHVQVPHSVDVYN